MYVSVQLYGRKWLAGVVVALLLSLCIAPLVISAANNSEPKIVYLTYDDGPSENTAALLDVLKEYDVQATFFVTAQYPDYSGLLRRISEEGHLIALHTYSHVFRDIYESPEAFFADIERLEELILETTGHPAAHILRFAGGSSNTISYRYGGSTIMRDIISECELRGYAYFDWTVDPKDAEGGAKSAGAIAARVVSGVQNVDVAVVLMHDGPEQSSAAAATELIIQQLRELGYEFDTLDDMPHPIHHRMPN